MSSFDVDLFVIGGGSGGVRAARVSAEHGARVALAEQHRLGGTCVVRGCIPKKLLVYAAEYAHHFADAAGFGWHLERPGFDWAELIRRKEDEVTRLTGIYGGLLERAGVVVYPERATLEGPHTVRIGDRRLTAAHVLIATGGAPHMPDIPGIEHAISSNEALSLSALPRHLTVVGGGYIAVELAHVFRSLGCELHMVLRQPQVLRGFDADLRQQATELLTQAGITLHTSVQPIGLELQPDGSRLLALSNGAHLRSDAVLMATGRHPSTDGLGLEELGVRRNTRGAIHVDEYSRSSVPHIHAVGDCTDRLALTPVAIREGQALADTLFGGKPTPVDHRCVPTAVFSLPPLASVGLTEEEARRAHRSVDIYRAQFRPLRHTLSGRRQRVLMKLVVDGTSERILGAHMIGSDAPEIIQCMAIALRMGARKSDLDATTALHPTTAEEFVLMRQKQPARQL